MKQSLFFTLAFVFAATVTAAHSARADDYAALPPAGTIVPADAPTTNAATIKPPAKNPNDGLQLGVEGFADHYTEPAPGVNNHARYGSVTVNYANTGPELHGAGPIFYAVDTRFSYGRNDYKSPSGTVNNIPQYEAEGRLRLGLELPMDSGMATSGATITPYFGIGERVFLDNGRGYETNLGYGGYNRKINQTYVPFGATVNLPQGGWNITPTLEYDQLIHGEVRSALHNFIGRDVENQQHEGFGVRGDVMVGQTARKVGWEVGPFFRYWDIKDSGFSINPGSTNFGYYEPRNHRWQVGAAAKVLFK